MCWVNLEHFFTNRYDKVARRTVLLKSAHFVAHSIIIIIVSSSSSCCCCFFKEKTDKYGNGFFRTATTTFILLRVRNDVIREKMWVTQFLKDCKTTC